MRITKHLSLSETRVMALGKPSDLQEREWYFQRYSPHVPISDDFYSSTEAGTTAPG